RSDNEVPLPLREGVGGRGQSKAPGPLPPTPSRKGRGRSCAMTAAVQTGTAGFLARYEAERDRLPGDVRQRDAAADAFRRAGLPGTTAGRREEAWKYTALRPVADASFVQPVASVGDSTLLARLPQIDAARVVFVDGEFRPELSSLPPTVEFQRFAGFGGLARPDREPLVALNTMLAADGAV